MRQTQPPRRHLANKNRPIRGYAQVRSLLCHRQASSSSTPSESDHTLRSRPCRVEVLHIFRRSVHGPDLLMALGGSRDDRLSWGNSGGTLARTLHQNVRSCRLPRKASSVTERARAPPWEVE